jgi:hypothetical protein
MFNGFVSPDTPRAGSSAANRRRREQARVIRDRDIGKFLFQI